MMILKYRFLTHTLFLMCFLSSYITPSSAGAGVQKTGSRRQLSAPRPQEIQAAALAGAAWPASITATASITTTAQYSITDLGTFGGTTSHAWAINEAGHVVGYSALPGGANHAFLWQDGVMTDLGGGSATDINDNGQVVGVNAYAFLWQGGVVSELPSLGRGSSAFEINNLGSVVGYVNVFDPDLQQGVNHAALWQNGSLSDLGTFGTEWGARAKAINNLGAIAVTAYISPTVHALLLENGNITNLGSLGYEHSEPEAINNNGQIVGYSSLASGAQRPFLWQAGAMLDLGTLGGNYNVAYDINDAGQVVGMSQITGGAYHAFLWEDDNENGQSDPGEMRDLNDLIPLGSGWDLTVALGINEAGQIVGYGVHNGQNRAFLLDPPRWTLMFYMAGDNDLSGSYPPIFEHLESVANTPGVNIIVLWDNSPVGDSAYIDVQYNPDPSQDYPYEDNVNRWPIGEVDMSAPATLSNFISWAMINFPAPHYALTLDDHGTGLGGGLCETDGTDDCAYLMSLAQMKQAFVDANSLTGEKIDVLYMAMCLMGMIEDAYQFRDYIDYYVASEAPQLTYTDYLPNLDADLTPPMLAGLFASNYAAEMEIEGNGYTISVGGIAQLPALVTATDQLADALLAHMDTITPTLTTIATQVQRYDNVGVDPVIDTNDTYVDLYHLASLIAQNLNAYPDIVSAAQAVMSAVDAYILYEADAGSSASTPDNSHGVSIFSPANPSSFYYAENNDFAAGTDWGGNPPFALAADGISWGPMLVAYINLTNPNGIDFPTPPEPRPKIFPVNSIFLPIVTR
jgi:probable HAF family extracellular repeat protein